MNAIRTPFKCPVGESWEQYTAETAELMRKVEAVHASMETILDTTQHLTKLDVIAEAVTLSSAVLIDMKRGLLDSAVGRNQIDIKTFHMVLRWFGGVMLSLVFIIGFLLIGEKFGFIRELVR